MEEKNTNKWYFSVVEEAIMNEDFNRKYPDYAGGRIEVWDEDEPYDVDEIRLMLPRKMFNAVMEAIDFESIPYFQIGNCRSEDLDNYLLTKKKK